MRLIPGRCSDLPRFSSQIQQPHVGNKRQRVLEKRNSLKDRSRFDLLLNLCRHLTITSNFVIRLENSDVRLQEQQGSTG